MTDLPDFQPGVRWEQVSARQMRNLVDLARMLDGLDTERDSGLLVRKTRDGITIEKPESDESITRRYSVPVIVVKATEEELIAKEISEDEEGKVTALDREIGVLPYYNTDNDEYEKFVPKDEDGNETGEAEDDTTVFMATPSDRGLLRLGAIPAEGGGGGQKWVRISQPPEAGTSFLMVQEVEQDFDKDEIVEVGKPFEAPTNIQLDASAYEHIHRNNIIIKLEKFDDVWYVDLTAYLRFTNPSSRVRNFC